MQQDTAHRMPRSSFEDQAQAEHQNLASAITPAIEAMLQVISQCLLSVFNQGPGDVHCGCYALLAVACACNLY